MTTQTVQNGPGTCGNAGGFRFSSPRAAVDALVGEVRAVELESVELANACGRVLGERVRMDRMSPAVDVSSMDGFAARLSDVGKGRLVIAGEVRIGQEPGREAVASGACLRMVTGGAVPSWTDVILKREDVREVGGAIEIGEETAAKVKRGEFIRRAGENALAGEVMAEGGSVITPAMVGALAAVGAASVRVHKAIRVGVISTGDEVVGVEDRPTDWQLRDSNGPALSAMLGRCGWVSGVEAVRVKDEEGALDAAVGEMLLRVDALLLNGGVSMGHRDFVPGALGRAGVKVVFHGVPQRPGRPVLGGVTSEGKPVLGLPGNPVSVLVTARRMGVPVLARRAGVTAIAAQPVVSLGESDGKTLHLWWHRPVRVVGAGVAELVDNRGSGDIISAGRSDGFIEMPPGETGAGPWPFYRWEL